MAALKLHKLQISHLGRILAALFNRTTMYAVTHPYTKHSIDTAYATLSPLLDSVSPLVFNLNREQFFIDEEPLDIRVNVSRVVEAFKKAGIQSISFYKGLAKTELWAFLEMFSSPRKYPNPEAIKKALIQKGVSRLKVNHVLFKKVTEDEKVVSGDTLEQEMPEMNLEERQRRSKQLFIDSLLESILTDEFVKTISIKNLAENPAEVSKDMIEADLTGSMQSGDGEHGPGFTLMRQLHIIDQEVEKNLVGEEPGAVSLSALADAVFEMKRQLFQGIEAQKTLGISYTHEELILEKANEITDKVLIQLVKEEYRTGEVSVSRLAQILRRLVPEADELRRLLPKIKTALSEEGMTLSEYLYMVQELQRELQSEGIATILKVSADDIGIDGDELIQEVEKNPERAAELIYLAAEIQKETSDEHAITDLLVDYIEKTGSKMALDKAREDGVEDAQQLRQAVTGAESQIVTQLRRMDVGDDVLRGLEQRLNQRVDEMLDKIGADWVQAQSSQAEEVGRQSMSLLQHIEQSVSESEELGNILKVIRAKAESNQIDENNFKDIYTEITREKQKRQEQEAQRKMPPGVYKAANLIFFIRKEILRSKRYDLPFSALAFSIIKAVPVARVILEPISRQAIIDALLRELSGVLRETDIVGQLGKNQILALLPMTGARETKLALRRCMKRLYSKPINVDGTPVDFKIVGAFAFFNAMQTPDADAFLKALSQGLMDSIDRAKYMDVYS
jgi:molybdenum-dependent DNA-binding transcriptional regulator ModE